MATNESTSEDLYKINDALTQLASTLGVKWSGETQEDTVLQELTMLVAEGFGIGG